MVPSANLKKPGRIAQLHNEFLLKIFLTRDASLKIIRLKKKNVH